MSSRESICEYSFPKKNQPMTWFPIKATDHISKTTEWKIIHIGVIDISSCVWCCISCLRIHFHVNTEYLYLCAQYTRVYVCVCDRWKLFVISFFLDCINLVLCNYKIYIQMQFPSWNLNMTHVEWAQNYQLLRLSFIVSPNHMIMSTNQHARWILSIDSCFLNANNHAR